MSMVCGLDLHRDQITFDALVVESGESWRGRVWQPDRERFRRWLRHDVTPRARRPGGVGGGGLHRLAVCRRGDHRGGVRRACRRSGRHQEGAWEQASRQDRPDRCPPAARSVGVGGSTRVVDPADRRVGVARARPVVQVVDRSAHHLLSEDAELFQHGVAVPEGAIRSAPVRARVADSRVQLSLAARQRIRVGYQMIDFTDTEAMPLKRALTRFGEWASPQIVEGC